MLTACAGQCCYTFQKQRYVRTWRRIAVGTWCGRGTCDWRQGQSGGCRATSCELGSSSPVSYTQLYLWFINIIIIMDYLTNHLRFWPSYLRFINGLQVALLGWWHLYNTHTHPFNGPLSRTTWVNQYQKGKTNLDFTETRDSEWQWHQLGHNASLHLAPVR